MFKIAQKIKRKVAGLLLFSFLNILTFLPGSQIEAKESNDFSQWLSLGLITEDELNRSTVLELILENVAGLQDALPESEKPDFSYDYFSAKLRCFSTFLPDMLLADEQPLPGKLLKAAAPRLYCPEQSEELLLQHHHFIFRLTPF